MILAKGQHCGSFSSPYLLSFNEQVRIDGVPVSDTVLVEALQKVDQVRGDISLTEFEFTTLAALLIFKSQPLDILLLEVGLGGGDDAVNIIDPDVTIITSIALDHEEYLGHTLEEIAHSESALLRPNKTAILGLRNSTIESAAADIHCKVIFTESSPTALALSALSCLGSGYQPIEVHLPGRMQSVGNWLIDVSHNIEAVTRLQQHLRQHKKPGRVIAVFSMLKDKHISEVIGLMQDQVDEWLIAPIDHPRGASLQQLEAALQQQKVNYQIFQNLNEACAVAKALAQPQDLVLAFGSFHVARCALLLNSA